MDFFVSDLLESVPGSFDVITANPPYLRDDEVESMRKIGWPEPEIALRGGRDGTALAERLIRAAPQKLAPNGWLLLEAAPLPVHQALCAHGPGGIPQHRRGAGHGGPQQGDCRAARLRPSGRTGWVTSAPFPVRSRGEYRECRGQYREEVTELLTYFRQKLVSYSPEETEKILAAAEWSREAPQRTETGVGRPVLRPPAERRLHPGGHQHGLPGHRCRAPSRRSGGHGDQPGATPQGVRQGSGVPRPGGHQDIGPSRQVALLPARGNHPQDAFRHGEGPPRHPHQARGQAAQHADPGLPPGGGQEAHCHGDPRHLRAAGGQAGNIAHQGRAGGPQPQAPAARRIRADPQVRGGEEKRARQLPGAGAGGYLPGGGGRGDLPLHRDAGQALLLHLPEDEAPGETPGGDLRPARHPHPLRHDEPVLRAAGARAQDLDAHRGAVQGLHRHAEVQPLPEPAHHGHGFRRERSSRSRSARRACTRPRRTGLPPTGCTRAAP